MTRTFSIYQKFAKENKCPGGGATQDRTTLTTALLVLWQSGPSCKEEIFISDWSVWLLVLLYTKSARVTIICRSNKKEESAVIGWCLRRQVGRALNWLRGCKKAASLTVLSCQRTVCSCIVQQQVLHSCDMMNGESLPRCAVFAPTTGC